jgi:hypothetical protein
MARAVASALERIHGVCPLEQVALLEALESDTEWDNWSLAQRSEPKLGPAWPVALPKTGAGERFAATCAEDPEAERAREEVRAELAHLEQQRSIDEPAGGVSRDDDDDSDDSGEGNDESSGPSSESRREPEGEPPKVTEGELRVERRPYSETRDWDQIPSDIRKMFGGRSDIIKSPNGFFFGITKPRRKRAIAAWVEDGSLRTAEQDELPDSYGPSFAERDDDGAALIGFDDDSVWEVVFAEGRARRLFKHSESLSGIAYGPEGRAVLLASSSLDVYRREGDAASLEARLNINGYSIRSVRGGRVLFVSCFESGDDGVTVFGFDGPTLRRLARVQFSVSDVVVTGDRVIVHDQSGDEIEAFELLGWGDLLAKLDAEPSAFQEVAAYTEADKEDEDEESDAEEEPSDNGEDDESPESDSSASDDDESSDDESSDDESDDESSDDESDDESSDDESSNDDEDEDSDDDEAATPKARRKKGPEDLAVQPSAGRVGILYLGRKSPPASKAGATVGKSMRAEFGGSSDIEVTDDGSLYYGWKKDGRRAYRFAVHSDGRLIPTDLVSKSSSTMMAVRWDRRQIVVASDGDKKLWSVSLPDGSATLVHDFSKEPDEDEIYSLAALASDRILVTTLGEAWLFSLATGTPSLESRGALDVQQTEAFCSGRAVVLEVSEGKPLRVWGVYEDGLRELAQLEVDPLDMKVTGPTVLVRAMGEGWYEIVNTEDAWQAAKLDASGSTYPRVDLTTTSKKDNDKDDDTDEEGDEDDDNDGDGDSNEEEEEDGGGDDDDDAGGDEDEEEEEDDEDDD